MINLRKHFNKRGKLSGFTLIETLVAIGIFTVIMSIAISSLLTIVSANAKAQSIKTAVNNINFAVDLVTTALQTSSNVKCVADGGSEETSCSGGAPGISFNSNSFEGVKKYKIYKDFETKHLKIQIGDVSAEDLIPPSINIDNDMVFYVTNTEKIPLVTMVLSGTINNKGVATQFNLQTNISKVGI